ncbi:hypothetical protein MFIFM68171_01994 [Madurella fahalii]|uniref:Uncharacterized protein n=1 Tax=Madurella fahalii TaxID=1157608 RepID=A0ABQ0G229_9PEZI
MPLTVSTFENGSYRDEKWFCACDRPAICFFLWEVHEASARERLHERSSKQPTTPTNTSTQANELYLPTPNTVSLDSTLPTRVRGLSIPDDTPTLLSQIITVFKADGVQLKPSTKEYLGHLLGQQSAIYQAQLQTRDCTIARLRKQLDRLTVNHEARMVLCESPYAPLSSQESESGTDVPAPWTAVAPTLGVDEESVRGEAPRRNRKGQNWPKLLSSPPISTKSVQGNQTGNNDVHPGTDPVSSVVSPLGPYITPSYISAQLAELLLGTKELESLYRAAVEKFSVRSFLRKHANILGRYVGDLRRSTNDDRHLDMVRTLGSSQERRHVSEHIFRLAEAALRVDPASADGRKDGGGDSKESTAWQDTYTTFFVTGKPFLTLKARVECLVQAPNTISETLTYPDATLLRVFLETRFNEAASGKYAWIADLKEVGYNHEEIAELLYERAHDSPWIFFEPTHIPPRDVLPSHHLEGCVHNLLIPNHRENVGSRQVVQPDEDREVRRIIEELCGIGGIAPSTRDRTLWNGTVRFTKDNSVASISYRHPSDVGLLTNERIFCRLLCVADRLCAALRVVQDVGYCCNSFTILNQHGNQHGNQRGIPTLRAVSFSLAAELRGNLSSARNCSSSDKPAALRRCYDTIKPQALELGLLELLLAAEDNDLDRIIDILALVLQILCVGFLSYAQAHLGSLQPFYLDTPLQRIELLGMQDPEAPRNHLQLRASLANLTCLEGMTKGPVILFGVAEPSGVPHDVAATPEDLLDTWGPGDLVFPSGRGESPVAIKIGGGYISPPAGSNSQDRYHWDRALRLPAKVPTLNLKDIIVIGGLVKTNPNCTNNEGHCWEGSSCVFEELGTYTSYSEVAEYQLGFQGGPDNFAITTNKIWVKRRGKTIKDRILERDNHMLVPFLDSYWGVKVSYCTGVAQRVQLRDLVADLLPAFARTLTNHTEVELWEQLSCVHGAIEAFRTTTTNQTTLHEWLRSLPDELHHLILFLVRQIFHTLKHTGLSPDGAYFSVAWPHNGIVNRCFRIPLDHHSKWMPILADSDDCATFAYIVAAQCLEVGRFTCRGPNPIWQNKIHLLETAVLCPAQSSDNTGSWTLSDGQSYFFRKLDDNLFWVRAQRDAGNAAAPAKLVRLIFIESLPLDVRHRLLSKEETKWERRLREKDLSITKAEVVSVSSPRI